ncbi:MAG: flagellar biosynthetic protein FliO [Syntrophomonadaceae bacterium]
MLSWAKKCALAMLLAVVLVQILAWPVNAVEDIQSFNQEYDKTQAPVAQTTSLWWEGIKIIIVLGLIVAAAWTVIRVFNRQARRRLQGNWLHVADEVMLGQNRGVVLCEVGQRLYALGVTDHNITCLFEIDNPQVMKEISQQALEGFTQQDSNPWIKAVSDFVDRRRAPDQKQEEFHQLMEEQIKRMRSISVPGEGAAGKKGRSNADQERTP